MNIDPDNPVVALCAAGMAVEGDSSAALALFEQAWLARRDNYDACRLKSRLVTDSTRAGQIAIFGR